MYVRTWKICTCSVCNGLYVENIFQFDRPGIGSVLTYTAIEGLVLLFLVVTIEVHMYVHECGIYRICTQICVYIQSIVLLTKILVNVHVHMYIVY